MKKILSLMLLVAALSFVACDSDKKTETTDGTEQMEAPVPMAPAMTAAIAHVCGADCKDGNHMFAHNEVGHTCTEACGAAHTCTDKCADAANHMYAHGEAGHTCTEDCTKM